MSRWDRSLLTSSVTTGCWESVFSGLARPRARTAAGNARARTEEGRMLSKQLMSAFFGCLQNGDEIELTSEILQRCDMGLATSGRFIQRGDVGPS